jgi:ribonuclease T2
MENHCPNVSRIALHGFIHCARAVIATCEIAIFLLIVNLSPVPASPADAPKPGQFDYYVLALSWSPSYCAGEAGQNDSQQCAPGRRFAFVVHGLWPQYAKGWPEFCETRENWVPQKLIDGMMDVMPSKKLIIHEWKKHGACSGLSQVEYFNSARQIFGGLRIPARYLSPQAPVSITPGQLVMDFIKSNKALTADMLSVQCGNATGQARLSELFVCVNKAGSFTPCGANEKRQCRAKTIVMPPVK